MPHGANYVHEQLRKELSDYIKSQYFKNSPLLLSTVGSQLDEEGLLYREPYIESSPAYITSPNGIAKANLEPWLRDYFLRLADAGLGVFKSPFTHQIKALETACAGDDLFVSTGTGSGKTECFMWPLLAKLATEAHNPKGSWALRGVRTIVMYPMNALVSDQISRLRRMIGDPQGKFISIFRDVCSANVRRPQFGMYTGRTPYSGVEPVQSQDRALEKTLRSVIQASKNIEDDFFDKLVEQGKIPAKANMESFLENLHNSKHTPDPDDAELITRFEMQLCTPDVLITNYSMLEYMLMRDIEQSIWDNTRTWLKADSSNKLLFVIDEAHMYRGSAGGEVALLIHRLFNKLGIGRDRVQFILTTASVPNQTDADKLAVDTFANNLTAASENTHFCKLYGEREKISGQNTKGIANELLLNSDPSAFESDDEQKLEALKAFWSQVEGFDNSLTTLDDICVWMYNNIVQYGPFNALIGICRGQAVSMSKLCKTIFPAMQKSDALRAVSVLLAIAPLAKAANGSVLFPARMHMLFKGLTGAYACTNPNCTHHHSEGGITLGEIFLYDDHLTCPECGSMVYELYNDRRCGALFYKGYIIDETDASEEKVDLTGEKCLWRNQGIVMDSKMKEIHLYIPPEGYEAPKKKQQDGYKIKPCYLDIKNGFIHFTDDAYAGVEGYRKLYYMDYIGKGRPDLITFTTCPHCKHLLNAAQLSGFSTRGNQSFFALIKSQFNLQPPVPSKMNNPDKFPNQGRKVLLFSDSRQRAAKLARDMSYASDIEAARQLFALAIKTMEEHCNVKDGQDFSLDEVYDFFCYVAEQKNVSMFHNDDRNKFNADRRSVFDKISRNLRRGRGIRPDHSVGYSPIPMQEYVLRLFTGGYNTLYDSATSWLEPRQKVLEEAVDMLAERGVSITDQEFIEFFNAWILSICDRFTAIGHNISDDIRLNVRQKYKHYGLEEDWTFNQTICNIMGWTDKNDPNKLHFKEVLTDYFLDNSDAGRGNLYVALDQIKPRFDMQHTWFKCEDCSELTPFLLKGKCPSCGSDHVHEMTDAEYEALSFWRQPVQNAISGKDIHVIDTEEHTAQLSHKDQRDDLWSKTEQYELRFQDLIQQDESPVDILSSTTTMEVGIDIGSLVAVGLRNIPPMRENYQQRAGRAGRRGSSLSTIVTFCEGGPHDTMYFKNPAPMFSGDPRKPWIDISSKKLLQRHLSILIIQKYLSEQEEALDKIGAADFLVNHLNRFKSFLDCYQEAQIKAMLPAYSEIDLNEYRQELIHSFDELNDKYEKHPDLFGELDENGTFTNAKVLLDALYEEGIIPTYSFPKNVVSTYITDSKGAIRYEIARGLDVAISEYAPGRSIVVDKDTYQLGGLYYPGSANKLNKYLTPAKAYFEDKNYLKEVQSCPQCGWFGLEDEHHDVCPFCGNAALGWQLPMLRPWGFAPTNASATPEAQLQEEYSSVQQPLYSTLPEKDEMQQVANSTHIRMASRTNQRIIMINKGPNGNGFTVCSDCGAAVAGHNDKAFSDKSKPIDRPYRVKGYKSAFQLRPCKHQNLQHVNLGYDFITDMLVLEFKIDNHSIAANVGDSMWISRAAQSLAEALRLAACRHLDVEFTELVTGYRLRTGSESSYVDIYLYDSLSSGAGYAVGVKDSISTLLDDIKEMLSSCSCKTACSKCLKHYRNQFLHGQLDRHAALELLEWGMNGKAASELSLEEQKALLSPLESILSKYGCDLQTEDGPITATAAGVKKQIVVYPAMWALPYEENTVFISDALLKYAKPYAVDRIKAGFSIN